MFESSAGVREHYEPARPALFAIPGSGSSVQRKRRRVAIAVLAFAFVAGNALVVRDLAVTRANADHLSNTDQRAGAQIATRQDELVRVRATLDAATADLDRATRARDDMKRWGEAVGADAATRKAQLEAVQARIDALHQQIGTLSECLGYLQGAVNAGSFNDTRHESQALGRVDPACGVGR